jgi:hypothetical protein
MVELKDEGIWSHVHSGKLTLKLEYSFQAPFVQNPRGKIIWNSAIPPSKSLHFWRLFHNKLRSDENLISRGFSIPSVCNLCYKQPELSQHLFFLLLICWLYMELASLCVKQQYSYASLDDLLTTTNKQASPQCKLVSM